jgi:hypothetical protein
MTLRDYFAGQALPALTPDIDKSVDKALQGIQKYGKPVDDARKKTILEHNYKQFAAYYYTIADCMLAVRSQNKGIIPCAK